MGLRKYFVFAGILSITLFAGIVLAQQEVPSEPAVPDVQWLWGEVVSVDAAKSEVVVKYLNYESEEEKQITVAADDKTTFENVNSLAQIKPTDTLSIDYVVDKDGKNLAKNISVEKPEEMNAPEVGSAPEAAVESPEVPSEPQIQEAPATEVPATEAPAQQPAVQ